MAWISGRVQSFLGPSRTARSASAAAAEEKGAETVTEEASAGRRRERKPRASSIMAGRRASWPETELSSYWH